MRPPEGALLAYRRLLRAVVRRLAKEIARQLFPIMPTRTDADDDPGSVGAARARLERIKTAVLGQDMSAEVQDAAVRVSKLNAKEAKRVLGVDMFKVAPNLGPEIDKFRTANVNLIESIQVDLLDQVSKLVDESWTDNARVEDLRDKILERFDVTESRADLIARDQVLKLNADLTRTRQQRAGVTEYIWTTSGDERVRGNPNGPYANSDRDHFRLDGTRQNWAAPPVINEKTGETAHPGQDYQCRCVAMPIVPFLEDPDLDEPL